MSVSETISAEGFERYMGGERLFASHNEAWREIKAWIIALWYQGLGFYSRLKEPHPLGFHRS
jgi:hypothetical protein